MQHRPPSSSIRSFPPFLSTPIPFTQLLPCSTHISSAPDVSPPQQKSSRPTSPLPGDITALTPYLSSNTDNNSIFFSHPFPNISINRAPQLIPTPPSTTISPNTHITLFSPSGFKLSENTPPATHLVQPTAQQHDGQLLHNNKHKPQHHRHRPVPKTQHTRQIEAQNSIHFNHQTTSTPPPSSFSSTMTTAFSADTNASNALSAIFEGTSEGQHDHFPSTQPRSYHSSRLTRDFASPASQRPITPFDGRNAKRSMKSSFRRNTVDSHENTDDFLNNTIYDPKPRNLRTSTRIASYSNPIHAIGDQIDEDDLLQLSHDPPYLPGSSAIPHSIRGAQRGIYNRIARRCASSPKSVFHSTSHPAYSLRKNPKRLRSEINDMESIEDGAMERLSTDHIEIHLDQPPADNANPQDFTTTPISQPQVSSTHQRNKPPIFHKTLDLISNHALPSLSDCCDLIFPLQSQMNTEMATVIPLDQLPPPLSIFQVHANPYALHRIPRDHRLFRQLTDLLFPHGQQQRSTPKQEQNESTNQNMGRDRPSPPPPPSCEGTVRAFSVAAQPPSSNNSQNNPDSISIIVNYSNYQLINPRNSQEERLIDTMVRDSTVLEQQTILLKRTRQSQQVQQPQPSLPDPMHPSATNLVTLQSYHCVQSDAIDNAATDYRSSWNLYSSNSSTRVDQFLSIPVTPPQHPLVFSSATAYFDGHHSRSDQHDSTPIDPVPVLDASRPLTSTITFTPKSIQNLEQHKPSAQSQSTQRLSHCEPSATLDNNFPHIHNYPNDPSYVSRLQIPSKDFAFFFAPTGTTVSKAYNATTTKSQPLHKPTTSQLHVDHAIAVRNPDFARRRLIKRISTSQFDKFRRKQRAYTRSLENRARKDAARLTTTREMKKVSKKPYIFQPSQLDALAFSVSFYQYLKDYHCIGDVMGGSDSDGNEVDSTPQ